MKRKEFLALVGLGAAAAVCTSCLGGCKPLDNIPTAPTNVDFTLSLNDAANAPLKTNGGYIYSNGIIIARTSAGNFVAVSSVCTHAGGTIYFDGHNNQFYCPSHNSVFAMDGTNISGPANSPLAKYNTALNATSLRIYS